MPACCRCELCGYDRCIAALEFHHVDGDKEFGISSGGHTRPWRVIKAELGKCQLLCANCHREVHNLPGSTKVVQRPVKAKA